MAASKTRKSKPSRPDHDSPELRNRARQLLRMEIDFIPNPEFYTEGGVGDSEFVDRTLRQLSESRNAPTNLPAHLRRLCEADLLSQDQETALFREMNYLKFCASSLRDRIDTKNLDPQLISNIEILLNRAYEIRGHIIRANMRLVMSIVKKFVTPQQSFDDMLSDGIFTLMQAVEKFDYGRGFRFSTYAYRAISRNAFRTVTSAQKDVVRPASDVEDWAFEQEDERRSSVMSDRVWNSLRELTTSMLDNLDRRERFIIRSRYALGSHRKVRTFQDLANKLGVSKERVRQLEQRAVNKLKNMAADVELDELVGASMA